MTVTAEFLAKFSASQKGANDFGGPSFVPLVEFLSQFGDGVGANQADRLFVDERTVNSASNDDIDLAGVLADAFGTTITLAELVFLGVINKPKSPTAAANTTNLTIGLGTNPFLGFLGGTLPTLGPLPPGAAAFLIAPGAAGFGTITGASNDLLRIANSSGAAATYQIAALGRSA